MSDVPHFEFDPPPDTPQCDGGDAACADMRTWAYLSIDHTDFSARDMPVLGYARAWAGAPEALEGHGRFAVRTADDRLLCTLERDGDRVTVTAPEREAALTAAALTALVERICQGAFAFLYGHHPHLIHDRDLLDLRAALGLAPPRTAPVTDDRLRRLAAATRMQPFPYETDWEAVHTALGLETPPDYRALIDHFGPGAFDNYLHVYGIGPRLPAFSLAKRALWWDAYFKETWREDDVPEPLRGRDVTIVNWGGTEDGAELFWIAEPGVSPDRWPVAIHTTAGERWECYDESTLEVLHRLAHNTSPTDLIPTSDRVWTYHPLW